MPSDTPDEPKAKGGQAGNKNAIRHGLRSAQLPPGCEYITNSTSAYRRRLEEETLAKHREIDATRAGLINAAVRHETRCALLSRWLKESLESPNSVPLAERMQIVRDLSAATELRNKAVEKLKLAAGGEWGFLDGPGQEASKEQGEEDEQEGGEWGLIEPTQAGQHASEGE